MQNYLQRGIHTWKAENGNSIQKVTCLATHLDKNMEGKIVILSISLNILGAV
jgi:hypothetical protein